MSFIPNIDIHVWVFLGGGYYVETIGQENEETDK